MCRSRGDLAGRIACLIVASLPFCFSNAADAQDQIPEAPPGDQGVVYLLSVRLNGWAIGLVARFQPEDDGRLSMPEDQFVGIGFRQNESFVTVVDGQRRIFLDQIEGVSWQIDTRAQTIDIRTPYALLTPNVLRLNPGPRRVDSRSNWGALLAYDIYGEYSSRPRSDVYSRTLSIDLEARLFSPFFTASNSGYYSIAEGDESGEFVRLDTTIDFDNPRHVWRLRLGDSITAGPIWLRTVRFGGVQFGREFSLRPDIITSPVPILSEDVSVPSTVDVFINGVQRFSQPVDPGAVRITDLPITTGANQVRVVITDQAGRRNIVYLPLYASTELLGEGLSTFNIEAGAERLQYAVKSFEYGREFASGSFGYGISDRFTIRGYGAASRDYWMAAGGGSFAIGNFLLADTSIMYSDGPDGSGWSFYGSLEHVAGPFSLFASYMHASDGFRDLAGNFGYTPITDQVIATGSVQLSRLGYFNLAYVGQRDITGDESSVLSGTYGVDLFRNQVNLSVSGYTETIEKDWGVVVSITVPIGRRASAYAEHSWRNGILSSAATVRGDGFRDRLYWEVSGQQGEFDEARAIADWNGEIVDARVEVAGSHGEYGVRAQLQQSLVFMDGRLNLAGRIDDGFAIVEVEGMPGVRVALENRVVGRTGRSGRLFVTGLNSYIANSISIDPLDLPIDAQVADTSMIVSPRMGGGLVATFPISHESSAIVTLKRPDGTPPQLGAQVTLEGSDLSAVVGFDGEIFLRGLQPGPNRLTVSWRDGQCTASFDADVETGTLPRLGPYTCGP